MQTFAVFVRVQNWPEIRAKYRSWIDGYYAGGALRLRIETPCTSREAAAEHVHRNCMHETSLYQIEDYQRRI